ncbi:MAG: T9SS type A sorting domain-containing protein [Bacteroidales bacterium]|nr:T9SS type A sorting domain-containing protein [Bacteroidales bacterium]
MYENTGTIIVNVNGKITGIEENEKFRVMETLLYPNPFKDEIFVETGNQKNMNLIIFDLFGNKLVEIRDVKDQKVNLAHLPDGLYIYVLQSGSGYLNKGKIIKR